jgi:hypothetical protein
LQDVPDERQTFRTWKVLEAPAGDGTTGLRASERRYVDPKVSPANFDRTGHEAAGAALTRSARRVESPAMIPADERVPIHLAFA